MAGGPYFWVGGSGTWDATTTTNWATSSGGSGGAGVPAATDNVTFDTLSNTTLYTVTVATGATCADLTASGPLTGNVTFSGTGASSIAGSFTLAATGVTWSATGTMTFSSTTTGKTITTNGTSLSSASMLFNVAGGGWALGSALTCSSLTINNGIFDTSSFSLSCTALISNASTARTINLGSSAVTCSTGSAVNFTTSTGLTFNAGTSTITATSNSVTISGGGKTFYNVVASNTTASGGLTLNQANTFNSVTVNPPSAGFRSLTLSANQTITGTLVASGGSASGRVFVRTSAQGTVFTLSVAAFSGFSDIDFRDITAAGTASWSTGTRIGDCTGNTGITFSTAKTVYWNLAGTQNISAAGWATSSGGSPSANNFPLAQDIAVFDNAGAAGAVTIDATNWNIGAFDFSTRTSAMSLVGSSPVIYKYFVWPSTLTVTVSLVLIFSGASAKTSTTQGYTTLGITLQDSIGGSLTLQDATTITGSFTLTSGTFDTAGFAVQSTSFLTSGSLTRALTLGNTTWTITGSGGSWTATAVTNFTLNAGTSTISFTNAATKQFSGNTGLSYYNINQAGAGRLYISSTGTTFNDIQNSYVATGATTITPLNTLTTANFTATGAAGKVLTLNSLTVGTAIGIAKTGGGTITGLDYLAVQDISFSPLVTNGTAPYVWYAGANSTNNGNVSGIVFIASTQTAYLLASGTSFTTPVDWNNASNTIHIFGAGGGGAGSRATAPKAAGAGGGGGGYTGLTNQTLSGAITYAIGAGGTAGAVSGGAGGTGGTTSWNSGASTATGGTGGTVTATPTSIGGTGGTGTYSGGAGGAGATSATVGDTVAGGGAGGAGGPNGIGGAGGVGFGSATTTLAASGAGGGNGGGTAGGNGSSGVGGTGGNNFLGTGGGAQNTAGTFGGGGGGAVNATGKGGGAGVDISSTIGGGGGPSGGSYNAGATAGIAGALYGAGGSGGASSGGSTTSGGAGGAGMIFIIYTPGAAPSGNTSNFFFMMQ